MKHRLRTPSPAFAVSLIALFVALGGTTYAVTSLPASSVGTAQLKNGAVTDKKVAKKLIVYGAKAAVVAAAAVEAGHANSADTATTATSATTATNAAHATNADHATTADSATNATNATNSEFSGNADDAMFADVLTMSGPTNLGGFYANDLTRVASAHASTAMEDTDAAQLLTPIDIGCPVSGFVLVNAAVAVTGAPSTIPVIRVWIVNELTGQTTWVHNAVLANDGTSYVGDVNVSAAFPCNEASSVFEVFGSRIGTGTATVNIDANALFSPFGPGGDPPATLKQPAAQAQPTQHVHH